MTRESQLSKRPKAPSPGPIKPGSPLHRLLQMIAEEIAKGADSGPPPVRKRQRKRP